MIAAYRSGDPYLAFAKLVGAVPHDATKKSHSAERELFKACVLAVQYGMRPDALALRIGKPPVVARDLLRAHQETFRVFWKWSDAAVDVDRAAQHRIWLDDPHRHRIQSAIAAELSDASERCRDAAARMLLGY